MRRLVRGQHAFVPSCVRLIFGRDIIQHKPSRSSARPSDGYWLCRMGISPAGEMGTELGHSDAWAEVRRGFEMTTEIPPVHPDVRGGTSQPDEERVRIDWGWKFGVRNPTRGAVSGGGSRQETWVKFVHDAPLVVFTVLNLPTDYNNDAVGLFLELDGSAIASKVRSQKKFPTRRV
ncbi:hypothetical protein MAPG_11704 [Magnaporthiopsis poae ATCC 64411]|uniref:Uncharacterized protein n=1 Tax=Magnaporthiopsis poae (strain ATCC 64411 / 73-15) TaxID=644358 RepID=A0A0C4EFZ2_MAGP6|nr:hypothetical protein MAPG_11704 [Magnaporthiopsis poae ATCC 64411]